MQTQTSYRLLIATMMLTGISGSLPAQQQGWESVTTQRDRYVTRFETQPKLTYTRELAYETQPVLRKSWNPFRKSSIEYRAVPKVKWVSKWQEQVLPITERQTQAETKWVRAPRGRSSSRLATKPAKVNPVRWEARRTREQLPYGGVAQMDEDVPRIGLKLQPMVR